MKRLLVLLLALAMAAMMFGCTAKPTDNATTPPQATEAPEEEATEAPEEEEPVDEPVGAAPVGNYTDEWTIGFAHLLDSSYDFNNPDDAVFQYIYERFKLKWDITCFTWADWDERSRIWINAGDMPTFMFYNFNITDFRNFVAQGLLGEFPEGWEENFPNVKKAMTSSSIGYPVAELVGGFYVLPHAINFNVPTTPMYTTQWSMHIRADWTKSLGYEVKDVYSKNELIAMWKDFLTKFDQLGLTKGTDYAFVNKAGDVYNLFRWGDKNWLAGIYYDETEGKYIWGLEKNFDTFVAGLTEFRQGVQEGWIHPNYYSFTANHEDRDVFYNGHAYACIFEGFAASVRSHWENFAKNSGLDPFEAIKLIVVTDDAGVHNCDEQLNFWASTIWRPDLTDEQFNRLLDLCNFVLYDETQWVVHMGFEGIDYKKNEDGTVENLLPVDPDTGNPVGIGKKYNHASIYGSFAVCADAWGRFDPALDPRIIAASEAMWAAKQKHAMDMNGCIPYDLDNWFYSSPIKDKLKLNYNENFTAIISSGEDIATGLTKLMEDNRALVEEVMADLNANVAPNKK